MGDDELTALRRHLLEEQGWRCACCRRVVLGTGGDPAYLDLDARRVVCHLCWIDPRRCVAAPPASGAS